MQHQVSSCWRYSTLVFNTGLKWLIQAQEKRPLVKALAEPERITAKNTLRLSGAPRRRLPCSAGYGYQFAPGGNSFQ